MRNFFVFALLSLLMLTACSKENTQPENSVAPASVSVPAKAAEIELAIVSDGTWRITLPEYAYWYSISPLSGDGNAKVKISVKENKDAFRRGGTIRFSLNGKEVSLPLEQAAGSGSESYTDKEVRIHTKNRDGKAANLLFLGDGFIQSDFTSGGAFDKAVDEAVKGWMAVEPYKSYKTYFNVYKMAAVSVERGASHTSRQITRNTAFGVCYTGNEGVSSMSANEDKVDEYIQAFYGADLSIRDIKNLEVIVIVNDARYGGTTFLWSRGPSIALCPMNRETRLPGGFVNILVHEAGGHGFGHLADEYQSNEGTIPADKQSDILLFQGYGLYQNVELTSDRTKVSWNDFFGTSGYGEVSVFEGGFNYTNGVWRSENISCMDINCLYFNAPSRRAIVQRIKSMAEETFNMTEFLQKDVQKVYPFGVDYLYTKGGVVDPSLPRLAPPIVRLAR